MRVLITGGTGFLGRAIIRELLAHGHAVTTFTRGITSAELPPEVRPLHADLRDARATDAAIAQLPIDKVIHLAGRTNARESFADPVGYYAANVTGTINLLSALNGANETGERPGIVFASTNAVYGSQHVGRISETSITQPESPYAASKASCEQLLGFQACAGLIGATILRFFNIAGAVKGIKDLDQSRIIPRILRAAATGEEVPLNGDGSTQRDFVHIADAAIATRLAVESVTPKTVRTYNVGSGTGTSIQEVISEVSAALGREIRVKMLPPLDEPKIVVADIDIIRKELGWTPTARSSLERIVRDTMSE